MTVYVDNMRAKYGRMIMCHMMADTAMELHTMAKRIGVKKKWFQKTRYPHYDICLAKKQLAIKYGAVEITTRQLIRIARVNQEE